MSGHRYIFLNGKKNQQGCQFFGKKIFSEGPDGFHGIKWQLPYSIPIHSEARIALTKLYCHFDNNQVTLQNKEMFFDTQGKPVKNSIVQIASSLIIPSICNSYFSSILQNFYVEGLEKIINLSFSNTMYFNMNKTVIDSVNVFFIDSCNSDIFFHENVQFDMVFSLIN